MRGLSLPDRLWSHVLIRGKDDCWPCDLVGYASLGYPQIWISGKTKHVHRVVWELANGTIPEGMLVLHKCDNPVCVNPDHLFLGTNLDNMRDKIAKGRSNIPRGSAQGSSILKEDDIPIIRAMLLAGRKGNVIADEFHVSPMAISDIKHKRRWGHIPDCPVESMIGGCGYAL